MAILRGFPPSNSGTIWVPKKPKPKFNHWLQRHAERKIRKAIEEAFGDQK